MVAPDFMPDSFFRVKKNGEIVFNVYRDKLKLVAHTSTTCKPFTKTECKSEIIYWANILSEKKWWQSKIRPIEEIIKWSNRLKELK